MAAANGEVDEVVLHLNSPEELFQVNVTDMFSASGRLVSGMEELSHELGARRIRQALRTIVVLPESQVRADTLPRLREAIERYCRLRLQHNETAARTHRREIAVALSLGVALAAIGLALSSYISQAGLPSLVKTFLGDGLFVVVAWVGLWYPLDELVHYRRPLMRERRVLTAIRAMDLTVRPDGDVHHPPRGGGHKNPTA